MKGRQDIFLYPKTQITMSYKLRGRRFEEQMQEANIVAQERKPCAYIPKPTAAANKPTVSANKPTDVKDATFKNVTPDKVILGSTKV